MNPDFLQQLNVAYDTIKREYAADFNQFEVIDTGGGSSTPLSTAYKVTSAIVHQLSPRQVRR